MEEGLVSVQFNQDFTSLGVGTEWGWALVSVVNPDNLEYVFAKDAKEKVHIVERLFVSSLAVIVSLDAPRKLRVFHCAKNHEIANHSFSNSILAVRLNRVRMVVCLERVLFVLSTSDLKVLHMVTETENPKGILALSPNPDKCYVAYPSAPVVSGYIEVLDALKLQPKLVIQAHDSSVASLAFNMDGSQLASASDKGTIIRVFEIESGNRLYEFRRGLKRYATIHCMAFSSDSAFLAVSSNTDTVHIFRLQSQTPVSKETTKAVTTSSSWLSWMAASLPSQVTDAWSMERAFATIKLPFQDVKTVLAIYASGETKGKGKILVASCEGNMYTYEMNTEEGGECNLLKEQSLVGEESATTLPNSGGSPTPNERDKVSNKLAELAVSESTTN